MPTWVYSDPLTGDICKTTNFSERHMLDILGNAADEALSLSLDLSPDPSLTLTLTIP